MAILAVLAATGAPAFGADEAERRSAPAAATEAAPEARPAVARDARLAGDAERTRLVIDLDRSVDFRAFTLATPPRVVIDLPDVTFALNPDGQQRRRGLVTAWRFGVFAPGKARVVLEAQAPVAIDKAFVLDAADGEPARLVVEMVPTSAAAQPPIAAAPTPPPVAAAPAPPEGDARPVIVLDPGHGGIDSGTTGYSAFTEKTVVLEIAFALKEKLEQSGTYRVVMTRTGDVFIPLGERVRIARANRADLFISLHADALARGEGQARGASVYTLSETASDADSARLAESENKADLIAGLDLSDETDAVAGILVDLAHRETRSFSAVFARTLVGAMKDTVRTHRSPLKSAGFRVLRAHDVPSVLVELGYMSSPEDRKQLTSDAWRERMAEAVARAVDRFFAARAAGALQLAADPASVPR